MYALITTILYIHLIHSLFQYELYLLYTIVFPYENEILHYKLYILLLF